MAGLLIQFDARRLAQAKEPGGLVDQVDAGEPADLIEIVVTGNSQSLADIQPAVGRMLGGPEHTAGPVAHVGKAGVDALVNDGKARLDDLIVQRRHRRDHFENGAGRIGGNEGTVKEGVVVLLQNVVVILKEGGKVIGGIAGAGQDLSGLDRHDHYGAALGIHAALAAADAVFPQIQNCSFQLILADPLQIQVDGKFHVVAGYRLGDIVLLNDGAIDGDGRRPQAVGTVELQLKGLLQAGPTHLGIHGVVILLVVFPLFCVHLSNVAENMGRVIRVVFADR